MQYIRSLSRTQFISLRQTRISVMTMDLFVSKLKRTKLPSHSLEGQVLFCFAWQTIRAGNAKRNNQEKKLPLDSFNGLSAVYIMVSR